MKSYNIILSFILALIISLSAQAQFISARIGVNGLTCSACSRSVEMAIRKLDFVEDIKMDLENTSGTITFKDSSAADMEQIAKAVVNAGFSVSYLTAEYVSPGGLQIANNYCLTYKGNTYQFIEDTAIKTQDELTLDFIGKEFMPAKKYMHLKDKLKPQCSESKRLYFVFLLIPVKDKL